jgi:hypothetical protein
MVVNSPAFSSATISSARFLGDSKTVIFIGDQLRPNDSNIFLWTAP